MRDTPIQAVEKLMARLGAKEARTVTGPGVSITAFQGMPDGAFYGAQR